MPSFPTVPILWTITALAFLPADVNAKSKKVKPPSKEPQDTIEVVGHLPATGGPVTRFVATHHYSSYYLYAEHEGGKSLTLIDVTKIGQPVILSDASYPVSGSSASLFDVAGTAALVTESQSTQPQNPAAPQTIRLMDFSDPLHPKITREFTGITAIERDDGRGLIFLANADGIWILHQDFAPDPEVQRAYAYYVIYGSSMYPPPK
jgi:hypothetical protein